MGDALSVPFIVSCSECMTEIQGKSILVRVSARFELARVRVIGSRLYLSEDCTCLRIRFVKLGVCHEGNPTCEILVVN